jgi:hypothetical protein
MARTIDARTARREFMVKDKNDQIFNVDMETHFQTVANTNDGSGSSEMVTNQTIRMEDGRLLSLQKNGTFKEIATGEIFEELPDDE